MKQADTKGSFTLSPQRLDKAAEAMERGVCATCGTPAVGEGGGYTACECNHHVWREATNSEKAHAAISAYLGDDMAVVPRKICDHEWAAFPVDARGNMICVVEPTRNNYPSAAFCIKCHMKAPPLSAELTERDAG